jgi:hypothetical protein
MIRRLRDDAGVCMVRTAAHRSALGRWTASVKVEAERDPGVPRNVGVRACLQNISALKLLTEVPVTDDLPMDNKVRLLLSDSIWNRVVNLLSTVQKTRSKASAQTGPRPSQEG